MKVLSLCGGIECGAVAIKRLGINPEQYFSSEIDKDAIAVATDNHPDIIHIGDIFKVRYADGVIYSEQGNFYIGQIDLVFGGTPCKGFSCAGSRIDFDHEESKLFFEFHRILKEVKPTYFLFENVKMRREPMDIISAYLEVNPVEINSALVSAQNRKRLYWTNINDGNIPQPENKFVEFAHISSDGSWQIAAQRGRRYNDHGVRDNALKTRQWLEPRFDGKTNCITTVKKDNVVMLTPINEKKIASKGHIRQMTTSEIEMCQTLPAGYTKSVPKRKGEYMVGRGWTVDVITHILSHM